MNAMRIKWVVIASVMALVSSCGPDVEEEGSGDQPLFEHVPACLDFCIEVAGCEGATVPPEPYCLEGCLDLKLDDPTPCDYARYDLRVCEGTLDCAEILLYQAGEPNPCSSQVEAEAAACE